MNTLFALTLLAASQAQSDLTPNEKLDLMKWELQEMLTDEEWKPERIGVDKTPAEVA